MAFEEGDKVVLDDKHSDYDGQTGVISSRSETMFDAYTYTVKFDDGKVPGVGAGSLSVVEDDVEETD